MYTTTIFEKRQEGGGGGGEAIKNKKSSNYTKNVTEKSFDSFLQKRKKKKLTQNTLTE